MVGDDENRELQLTYSQDSGLDVSSPKHGKVHGTLQRWETDLVIPV